MTAEKYLAAIVEGSPEAAALAWFLSASGAEQAAAFVRLRAIAVGCTTVGAAERRTARSAGLKRYVAPCRIHGPDAERLVSNGNCIPCSVDRCKAWKVKNRPTHLEVSRASYAKHADQRRAEMIVYKAENPEICRANQHNRRARIMKAEGRFTAADVRDLLRVQRGRCAHTWCKAPLLHKGRPSHHIDHILALSRGGANDRRNIQLLCKPCNLRKHATHPIEFAQQHGMLV